MTHVPDDLYMGNFFGNQGMCVFAAGADNPSAQVGVGPTGRVFVYDITPAAYASNLLAAAQALTSGVAMTLRTGTGITKSIAPDGSGATVYVFDVPRAVSMTTAVDMSSITFTIVGYDVYGRRQTQAITGPSNFVTDTVYTQKAFASVASITPSATSAQTISAGNAVIFGLPWAVADAGYIISQKWNGTSTGTLVVADTTSPATSSTGDTRGTVSIVGGTAADGTKRLVVVQALSALQVGTAPTVTAAIGVTPA